MTDFLICYEHINREIENDALLKHELEKRGYSCEIIRYDGPGIFLYSKRSNRAKVVVAPWLRYNENVYHFLKLSAKPYKIVNLQWEQVYANANIKNGLVNTVGESLKGFHLCWGENSRTRLLKAGVKPENAIIVGAIQMDYGFSQFDTYFLSKEHIAKKFNLDMNKRWVLYISSFGFANYNKKDLDILQSRFGQYIYDLANMHEESQRDMLLWIERLLREYECEFIYRPHPSERKLCSKLKAMEKEYSGFYIISDYSVRQWAKVCDKVNLWISTSNAELLSMGVDYGIVRPLPVTPDFEVETMSDEEFICDYEAFKRFNTSLKSEDINLIQQRRGKITKYYSYDTVRPSYKRIADCLIHILENGAGQNYRFSIKEKLMFEKKELKRIFISYLLEKQMRFRNKAIVSLLPVMKHTKSSMQHTIKDADRADKIIEDVLKYLDDNDPF